MTKKKKSKSAKKTSKKDDPGWRAFERLIARIEGVLVSQGAVVTWNDRLRDLNNGTTRQIDVSIKQKVGSASVLVILECRKRGRAPTVQWIEEVAQRRQSVGANKVIAVSPRPFGPNATKTAERLGVEIRQCDQVTTDDALGWLSTLKVVCERHRGHIVEVALKAAVVDGDRLLPDLLEAKAKAEASDSLGKLPMFRDATGTKVYVLNDLLTRAQRGGWKPAQTKDGEWETTRMRLTATNLFVPMVAGLRRVEWVEIEVRGRTQTNEVPLDFFRYQGGADGHRVADGKWLDPSDGKLVSVTVVGPETLGAGPVAGDIRMQAMQTSAER